MSSTGLVQIFCARLFVGFLTAICHLAERDSSWQSNFDLLLLVILYIELKKNIFKRTRSLRPKPVLLDGSQNSENNHNSISLAAVRQVVIGYEYSGLWQKNSPSSWTTPWTSWFWNPPTIIHIRFFDELQSLLFEKSTDLERGNGGNITVAFSAGPDGPTAAIGALPGNPARKFPEGFVTRKSFALACSVGFFKF